VSRSAVQLGYVHDSFVHLFVPRPVRRPPLINRGYYAREYAIYQQLRAFLGATAAAGEGAQVLVLGAGFDTRFFQLALAKLVPESARYFEVDFAAVTTPKIRTMVSGSDKGTFLDLLRDVRVSEQGDELYSQQLTILSGDLRQFDAIETKLAQHGFDLAKPTFVLSECVLIYLKKPDADHIVQWAGSRLAKSVFVCYEMIRPNDGFGEVMVRNLEVRAGQDFCFFLTPQDQNRGIVLHSLNAYPDPQAQALRYTGAGFNDVVVHDMLQVYNECIPTHEKVRVSRLEFLDEVEEFNLIMRHYCCVSANRNMAIHLRQEPQQFQD